MIDKHKIAFEDNYLRLYESDKLAQEENFSFFNIDTTNNLIINIKDKKCKICSYINENEEVYKFCVKMYEDLYLADTNLLDGWEHRDKYGVNFFIEDNIISIEHEEDDRLSDNIDKLSFFPDIKENNIYVNKDLYKKDKVYKSVIKNLKNDPRTESALIHYYKQQRRINKI